MFLRLLRLLAHLAHVAQWMDRDTDVSLSCELMEVQRNHTGSLRTDDPHLQSAIREPGISTAISPLADVVEAIDEIHL
jgi:hypothetical protein